MIRTLLPLLGALALVGCENEHGDAPRGTFAPGGPIDDRGNAATSRSLQPTGSAEAPAAFVDLGQGPAWETETLYDAGAQIFRPTAGAEAGVVEGRVVAVEEGRIRIAPTQGEPISLQIDPFSQVTLGGSLVAGESIRQGAEVRASYLLEAGERTANTVSIERYPGKGIGLWREELEPDAR